MTELPAEAVRLDWSEDANGRKHGVIVDRETGDVLPAGIGGTDWWWFRLLHMREHRDGDLAGNFRPLTPVDIWPDEDSGYGYHSVAVGDPDARVAAGYVPPAVVTKLGELEGRQIIHGRGSDIAAITTRGTPRGSTGPIYVLIGSTDAIRAIVRVLPSP